MAEVRVLSELDAFNPAIDRYDCRSVARLFAALWPERPTAAACATLLAESIRTAHEIGAGCWSVSMFADRIRLNVGQVEVLTLDAKRARLLFAGPITVAADSLCDIWNARNPVYPSVPIDSAICIMPPDVLSSLPPHVSAAHHAYIREASLRKRRSPFKAAWSPAVVEYVEAVTGTVLPRPSYLADQDSNLRVQALAEEVDGLAPFYEGAKYRLTVNAYERAPKVRQLCILTYGTACFICNFSFGGRYGPVVEGLIHVHHLRALADIGSDHEVDPVADLRPVCPNCHAVLHSRTPPYTIDEVRSFLNLTLGTSR
jgi:hypothetical protein